MTSKCSAPTSGMARYRPRVTLMVVVTFTGTVPPPGERTRTVWVRRVVRVVAITCLSWGRAGSGHWPQPSLTPWKCGRLEAPWKRPCRPLHLSFVRTWLSFSSQFGRLPLVAVRWGPRMQLRSRKVASGSTNVRRALQPGPWRYADEAPRPHASPEKTPPQGHGID